MTVSQSSDRAVTDAQRTWFIGGVLLIAATFFSPLFQPALSLLGAGAIGMVFFPAALVIFAFGIRGSGSVTARRPLGTIALTALAGWIVLVYIVTATVVTDESARDLLRDFSYVDMVVTFVLALIAVIQIARAGVVPRPWNWAPGWVAGGIVVTSLLGLIAFAGVPEVSPAAVLVMVADSLVRGGGAVFLGIVAIVLADRMSRTRASAVSPEAHPSEIR